MPGSLRAIIANAHSGDTIVFDDNIAGMTIGLTNGELLLSTNLIIQGETTNVTISGNNISRVFEIASGATDTISDLKIINGNAASGGCIYNNNQSTLSLNDVTITGGGATFGAGIYNLGTLTVSSSILKDNFASNKGGGIFNNGGTVTVEPRPP